MNSNDDLFEFSAPEIFQIQTKAAGPAGSLPLTEEMLLRTVRAAIYSA